MGIEIDVMIFLANFNYITQPHKATPRKGVRKFCPSLTRMVNTLLYA